MKRISLLGLVLVACGGAAANPAPTTPTSAPTTEAKPVEEKAADAKPADAKPADAKPAEAKDAQPDVAGQWCGKQVADAASCKGDEVFFVDLKVAPDGAVTGEFCEAYKKDCEKLSASTVKGNELSLAYSWDKNGQKGSVKGELKLGADGLLAGDLKATKKNKTKSVPVKLYRVK